MTHTPARGMVILLALVLTGIMLAVASALVSYLTTFTRAERVTVASSQALMIAEGGLDYTVEKLNADPNYAGEANIALGAGQFTSSIASVDSNTKRVTITAYVPDHANPTSTKVIKANVALDNARISFRYAIQSGLGGFTLQNSSSIQGNVYSGGSVIGSGGNMIYGDVVSAGATGLVYGIHATSSVYAHTIGNAGTGTTVDKNAYYTVKTNTTVSGQSFPNSPDLPIVSLPISDAQITEWENIAAAGGTIACNGGSYKISSGTTVLGPKKISCDLLISNSAKVTIAGHLWVTGNITIQNSSEVKMDPALGATNVAIIADNPSNRLTSSIITTANTATFKNSGTNGSFVYLISQNNSAELGGNTAAINLSNSATALVAYAAHGLIPLANSVSLKEVTAYKVTLQNSAKVIYDTGLQSSLFDSGPGGSWSYISGTYAITD